MLERDDRGRLHVPRYRVGCYYGRMEDCCWACMLRLLLAVLLACSRWMVGMAWYRHYSRVGVMGFWSPAA
ncbi:hypothetical protein [Saliphagus infecundisoli]|uniref:Uncharacterized protein n=1 Tax=Saliphagus infecundisoli TaxID=1849069 RepID=A0ABD5QF98_9EURY|nr:hypothetical protein [Saliphagus infecundisoli]